MELIQNKTLRWLSFVFLAFMLFDLVFHFTMGDVLKFSWFNWQGDVNFTTIGFINWLVRFLFVGGVLWYQPKWLPIILGGLVISVIPFVSLAITSLYVFAEYVGLYMYWFEILVGSILVLVQALMHPFKNSSFKLIIFGLSVLSAMTIIIEYQMILGGYWSVEFAYSVVQHLLYDIGMIVIGGLLVHFVQVESI